MCVSIKQVSRNLFIYFETSVDQVKFIFKLFIKTITQPDTYLENNSNPNKKTDRRKLKKEFVLKSGK